MYYLWNTMCCPMLNHGHSDVCMYVQIICAILDNNTGYFRYIICIEIYRNLSIILNIGYSYTKFKTYHILFQVYSISFIVYYKPNPFGFCFFKNSYNYIWAYYIHVLMIILNILMFTCACLNWNIYGLIQILNSTFMLCMHILLTQFHQSFPKYLCHFLKYFSRSCLFVYILTLNPHAICQCIEWHTTIIIIMLIIFTY